MAIASARLLVHACGSLRTQDCANKHLSKGWLLHLVISGRLVQRLMCPYCMFVWARKFQSQQQQQPAAAAAEAVGTISCRVGGVRVWVLIAVLTL